MNLNKAQYHPKYEYNQFTVGMLLQPQVRKDQLQECYQIVGRFGALVLCWDARFVLPLEEQP